MHQRATFVLCTAALSVLVGVGVWTIATSQDPLSAYGAGGAQCKRATSSEDWRAMNTRSVEGSFGGLTVRSPDTDAYVINAEVVEVNGTVRLEHVALVPDGHSGTGASWPRWVGDATHPARELPTHVLGSPHPGILDPNRASRWEIVVGLSPVGDGGEVRAIRLTYVVRGYTYQVTVHARFGVFRTAAMCDEASGPL